MRPERPTSRRRYSMADSARSSVATSAALETDESGAVAARATIDADDGRVGQDPNQAVVSSPTETNNSAAAVTTGSSRRRLRRRLCMRRSVWPLAAERHGGAALRTGPVGVELLRADHVGRSALRTDRLQRRALDVNDFAHPAAGWS